jgi:hypothetical protein
MNSSNGREVNEKLRLQEVDDDVLDGVMFLRRRVYRCSKEAWYAGPAKRLPIVQISAGRKAVRRRDWRADIAAHTTAPRAVA